MSKMQQIFSVGWFNPNIKRLLSEQKLILEDHENLLKAKPILIPFTISDACLKSLSEVFFLQDQMETDVNQFKT